MRVPEALMFFRFASDAPSRYTIFELMQGV